MAQEYGAKVSKPGYDVKTATPDQLVYSSKYNTLRVFASGSGSINLSSGNIGVVTIAHNLGYRPAFAFYSEIITADGNYRLMPYTFPIGGDAGVIPYIDNTNLKIRYGANHVSSNTTIHYRYFIYYNKAY